MSGETILTIVGNTVAAAELRFTPSGAAVANFTVASTPRTFDRQSNEWRDGDTIFMRCAAWREMAENVAETLADKGMRVIVQGRLKQRSYEAKDGTNRTVVELDVDEVGPSLRYASAKVNRNARQDSGGFGGGQRGGGQARQEGGFGGGGRPSGGQRDQPQGGGSDPWSQSSGGNYDWGAAEDEPPPF